MPNTNKQMYVETCIHIYIYIYIYISIRSSAKWQLPPSNPAGISQEVGTGIHDDPDEPLDYPYHNYINRDPPSLHRVGILHYKRFVCHCARDGCGNEQASTPSCVYIYVWAHAGSHIDISVCMYLSCMHVCMLVIPFSGLGKERVNQEHANSEPRKLHPLSKRSIRNRIIKNNYMLG